MLIALLLPELNKAKETARQISCLANHKQLGVAFQCYNSDNNGWWVNYGPAGNDAVTVQAGINNWTNVMIGGDYLKPGRCSYDISLHCPSLKVGPSPDSDIGWTRCRFSDYIINGVDATSGWGGGLKEEAVGQRGCMDVQIPMPSAFAVLVDRWDKTVTIFHNKHFYGTMFPKYNVSTESKTANPFSHSNGNSGNYLFADGHATAVPWQSLRWSMFRLRQPSWTSQDFTLLQW